MISSLILALFKIISTAFTFIFTILAVNQYMEVMESNTSVISVLAFVKLDLITFQYSTDSCFLVSSLIDFIFLLVFSYFYFSMLIHNTYNEK